MITIILVSDRQFQLVPSTIPTWRNKSNQFSGLFPCTLQANPLPCRSPDNLQATFLSPTPNASSVRLRGVTEYLHIIASDQERA